MGLQEWVLNSGHLGKIGCERVTPFLECWSFEATSGGGGRGYGASHRLLARAFERLPAGRYYVFG